MITDDNGECKKVKLNNVLPTKDPVQDILVLELALTGDESEVVGIDLNGEIVVRKWTIANVSFIVRTFTYLLFFLF